MDDLISKRSATERLIIAKTLLESILQDMPTAEPRNRLFEEVVVEYPDPDKCAYQEYKGKPYYSIRYREDGQDYLGFGTYKPEVLSRYLKEYFVHPVEPRKGKWKLTGRKNIYGGIEIMCDVCGETLMTTNVSEEHYCRNCGARMEE